MLRPGAETFPRLPDPDPPFPLTAGRYQVTPGLRRLGEVAEGRVEEGFFDVDSDLARYTAAKLDVLAAHEDAALVIDEAADRVALVAVLWRVLGRVAEEHPYLVVRTDTGVVLRALGLRLFGDPSAPEVAPSDPSPVLGDLGLRARRFLESRRGVARLAHAVALSVQEDLVVVHAPPDREDRAELMHVCFPGHWDPREKIGRGFGRIHAPVAHAEGLVASRAALVRAMVEKGPFVRFVWGVSTDDRLAHNPGVPGGASEPLPESVLRDGAALAAHTFLRVERQTTMPIPDSRRSVFTIRVYFRPVPEVARDPERRRLLADGLASMDADSLAYKGLERIRDPLVAWLRAL